MTLLNTRLQPCSTLRRSCSITMRTSLQVGKGWDDKKGVKQGTAKSQGPV